MATSNSKSSPFPALRDGMSSNAMADPVCDEKAKVKLEHADQASEEEKNPHRLASVTAPIEALGLEDWQKLEKKLVRRLDMTLMPMLWVLYLFNYLDRASIS
ncbi:major facilitator superfamily transporter [Colletotrichum tofieldiae]|nr:major facilitator superfamily transporter [Colletotrichum tofieldiae]